MFDPIKASDNIRDEYVSYITTFFHLADQNYARQFAELLQTPGTIAKGPYLDITDSFELGKNISTLIDDDEIQMSPLFHELEPELPDEEKEIKIFRNLYKHQEKAIRKIIKGKNIVVTTGTGSGKTECFILPVINHLLKEKEADSLDDGVRAIIIYPMNALANDQMKRLRSIFKEYPAITFGVYNGDTAQDDIEGISKYGEIHKDRNGRALKPLKNEVISRETMQKHPPHILITNYAMLEYMMLRPKDDLVFAGAKLRFLILDEAHIYRGATGIETSLLLRRLKARISNPGQVQHILTSATLGEKDADKDIVSFASNLCDAVFDVDDIIRSKPAPAPLPDFSIDYPMELFDELAHPQTSMDTIFEKYKIEFDSSKSESELLYDLCVSSTVYKYLRKCADQPMTVHDITLKMRAFMNLSDEDLVNLIYVASKAEKNKTSLIKARYHMFTRALEGAFITINKDRRLFLNRQQYYLDNENESWKVFEAAVCDDCGRIGIAGKINNDHLMSVGNRFDDSIDAFLLLSSDNEEDVEEEEIEDENEIGRNDYFVCAKCGEIHHTSQIFDFKCGHGDANFVKVRKSERSKTKNDLKCPGCGTGSMKLFYIGYDAATEVLGTELFEQLPEIEEKLTLQRKKAEKSHSLFSAFSNSNKVVENVRKNRQFLVFSDSRSEAAYFATHMPTFYKEFLRRRGIYHVINKNKENISKKSWEISTLVNELTSYFNANRSFSTPEDKGDENLTAISRCQAWIAVLNEMVNARRSTSLVSLGILNFVYKGNTDEIMKFVADTYGQNVSDTKALFNLLVMDIIYNGAIEGDTQDLTDDEREYIYFSSHPRRFIKCKTEKDRNKNYLNGWIPRVKENGKSFNNGRISRIVKMLNISEKEAKDLLEDYWEGILVGGDYPLSYDITNSGYYFSTDKFTVTVEDASHPIYECRKCKKTTMFNCKNTCPVLKCGGELKRVSHDSLIKENHYARLYSEDQMSPLHIKEHTAQLGRKEQQRYQELFVKKQINALSCSTTFEMGVDVGDLETVYLRNMPPSPANYVQRAGRAGRSTHSTAYSLTFSKLSSHDFTFFEHPERMISGKIGVPVFSISNEKIILRHIFAVAFSHFLSENPDVYNKNDADVFLNQDGYERFVKHLHAKPKDLEKILLKSIPSEMHSTMGLLDWSWMDKLVGEDGPLYIAVTDFRKTVEWYEKEVAKYLQEDNIKKAASCEKQLEAFRRSPDDHQSYNELIEFLVRNNVLPKYGFPVDTVELHQGMKNQNEKKLQMVRDLQLAIAEYAPDSQVVADGKLYTSRYIRKLPQTNNQSWKEVYIAQCENPSCMTWNHRTIEPSKEGENCISCGEKIKNWQTAIEPRKGFIADTEPKDVPLRKPERSFRSDDYYIGDPTRKIMKKKCFKIQDEEKIRMETSANDSLMVVCNDHFFVCEKCGYSISSSISGKSEKDFNSFAKSHTKKHDTPWGSHCNGKLIRKELCHTFKTDVVQITFGTFSAKSYSTMLSVMYALLEATSRVLDIERSDIKGCLHRIQYGDGMIYEIVLYDAVAGGAGHVRRLVTDDCNVFQKVIGKAIEITEGCTCDPSCYNCLRNYYNQSIHEELNRFEASSFLRNYYGSAIAIPDDQFFDDNGITDNQVNMDKDDLQSNELNLTIQYSSEPSTGLFVDDIKEQVRKNSLLDNNTGSKDFQNLSLSAVKDPAIPIGSKELNLSRPNSKPQKDSKSAFEYLIDDYDDKDRRIMELLASKVPGPEYEWPYYNTKIADIWPTLFWYDSKTAVFLPSKISQYKLLKKYNWFCYLLDENTDMDIIFSHIQKEK